MKSWLVYMIRCRNGNLYTGITLDIEKRFEDHVTGRGAKYLRGKGPLVLVWLEEVCDRSTALRLESQLKKLSKLEKEALITGTV